MTQRFRRLVRLFCCLLLLGHVAWAADPAKTLIQDTLYRADGSLAAGTLVISWPAFVTADGKPVAAGAVSVKVRDGVINIPLVPTQGATPAGTYYKVVVTLDNGASSQEYWSVPALSPTTIAAIRSSVVPATVALQVVSRDYVDSAIAAATGAPGNPLALNKGGSGQSSWSAARCVRVSNDGARLESAPDDCNVASNADMVDGQHASSFQAALANVGSLAKIGESDGNPLWNGSAWPGGTGGGSGNATQIQGKAVETPDTAGQQLTYDGTKFAKQAKRDIEVRDLAGVDCTGASSSAAALNALTGTQDAIAFKTLSFKGCSMVRLDAQWLIKYQTGFTIDFSGATMFGCNGSAVPLVLIQRSGNWTLTADTRNSGKIWPQGGALCGAGGHGNFTGSIATDNDAVTYPGGYTTTAGTVRNLTLQPAPNAQITGYCAFCTSTAVNQENFVIERNIIGCNGSQGQSIGVGLLSGNAQSANIAWNNISGCFWGVDNHAPFVTIQHNLFSANGNWDICSAPQTSDSRTGQNFGGLSSCGAALFHGAQVVEANQLAEGSGAFLFAPFGVAGNPAVISNNLITPDWVTTGCYYTGCGVHGGHAVPVGQRAVELGNSNNVIFTGNTGDNRTSNGVLNTVPLIGSNLFPSGGAGGRYTFGNNSWLTGGILDPAPPINGMRYWGTSASDHQDATTYDELMSSMSWSYFPNAPLKIWRTGTPGGGSYTDYAIGAVDRATINNVSQAATSLNVDVIRNDASAPTYLMLGPKVAGGLTTVAAPTLAISNMVAQGGSSGSTWGYKIVGVSSGGTTYATAEMTVSSAATLDASHWNEVLVPATPGYSSFQLWLTTQPGGAGRTLGMIASVNLTAVTSQCTIGTDQGCHGADPYLYFFDKGQATITAGSPPANTADGSLNLALGARVKIGGSPITSASLLRGEWTASASSTQGGSTPANAIDGDTATKWTGLGTNVDLIIDTGSVRPIAGLSYTPYTGGYRVLGYSVSLSSDGVTYGAAVASGTFANDNTVKTVTWTPTSARYVKFTAVSSGDGNNVPTVAELWIDVVQSLDAHEVDGKHASDFLAATTVLPSTKTSAPHQWMASYDATTGAFTQTQPAFTDISGSVAAAQLPNPGASALGGVKALTCSGTDKLSAIGTDGLPVCSADQTSGGGSGITSLNTLTAGTQTLAKQDDTNVTLGITSASSTHTFTLGWTGTLAKARGGAGADMTNVTFPSSGTLAVTSDLPSNEAGASNNFLTAYNASTHTFSRARPTWADIDKTTSSLADLAARACANLSDAGGACSKNVGTTAGTVAAGDHNHSGVYVPVTTTVNGHALSGNVAVTASDVGLGSVTNDAQTKAAVVPNTAPSAGQILVGNAGGTAYAPVSMSSDATLASTGALSLRSGLNVRSCEVVIGGTGTNGVLQDTDDWAADCKNKWGVTFTITAVECYADAGSPTVMVAVSSGSNVLSGNLTCGTASWASGTLNGTPTLASNGTLDFNVVSAGGTAKIIRVLVTGTI